MVKRRKIPPLTEPGRVQDTFASGFAVQDWEDWVRLIAFADDVEDGNANGGATEVRKKSASLVIPRSAVPGLVEALRESMGLGRGGGGRHS